MTLYNYFEQADSVLHKPHSSLSMVVLASTITAANEAVKKVIVVDNDTGPSKEEAAHSSRCGV